MGENFEDQIADANMNNSQLAFDNLTILKEFSNIVNLVRNEDFLETVPKAKLRRVKWVPMFNCLKQGILDEMIQELSSMWEFENIPEKLEILEKQKEKFGDINHENWRPQNNDVTAQLRASDAANLKKQKMLLESLVKEYDARVNRLKRILTAKRGYLKAMQMDILKYQKKSEDLTCKINEKLDNHSKLADMIITEHIDIENINWQQKDLELQD
ncbi:uncharacterized protein [Epargyreus clarus]|uniref:uncharacterized protein n=1 Tax=Epargyreus clarus TaxID=520877 RepID=UPI003C2D2480